MRIALCFLALALPVAAAPTRVLDTLYNGTGQRANGTCIIEWAGFTSPQNVAVSAGQRKVQVRSGVLDVMLEPNQGGTPVVTYRVRCHVAGASSSEIEYWSVPVSAVPVSIAAIRVAIPSGNPAITSFDASGRAVDFGNALSTRPARNVSDLPATCSQGEVVFHVLAAAGQNLFGCTAPNTWVLLSGGGSGGALPPGTGLVRVVSGVSSLVPGLPDDCAKVNGTSGACGGGQLYVDREWPVGAIDGSNRIYALAQSPSPASSLAVHRNGILQREGVDYTLAGSTITFAVISTPQAGDFLEVSYRYGVASPPASGSSLPKGRSYRGNNANVAAEFGPCADGEIEEYDASAPMGVKCVVKPSSGGGAGGGNKNSWVSFYSHSLYSAGAVNTTVSPNVLAFRVGTDSTGPVGNLYFQPDVVSGILFWALIPEGWDGSSSMTVRITGFDDSATPRRFSARVRCGVEALPTSQSSAVTWGATEETTLTGSTTVREVAIATSLSLSGCTAGAPALFGIYRDGTAVTGGGNSPVFGARLTVP